VRKLTSLFNLEKVRGTPIFLVTMTVFMIGRFYTFFLLVLTLSSCGLNSRHITYEGRTEKYTVVGGDTLGEIANRYATSIDQLAELNYLDDPDVLEPGQTLLVPATLVARANKAAIPSSKLQKVRAGPNDFQGGQLKWPVNGGYIISKFGPRDSGFHDGLDIAAVTGTSVFAAHDGTVVYSDNELGGYGELVIVKSATSLITIYAHNSRRSVRVGDKVHAGDLIAEVGQTGHAEGPHCHFEVRVKDKAGQYAAVDPAPLLRTNERPTLKYRINESLSPLLAKLSSWTK
jgi:murein DD-endopeptidase MepM/ murein hydrolase activator NlpD